MVPIAPSIPEPIVRENVARLADLLRERDIAACVVFDASNMLAFAGTPHASWDRLTCAAVTRDGQVVLVCPAFERPAVAGAENIAAVTTWREEEDPFAVFVRALGEAGVRSGRVAVDGRIWLRAWDALRAASRELKFVRGEALIREVRICKSPAAQQVLREASRRGEELFRVLAGWIEPGVREIDLHQRLQAHFAEKGLAVDPMIQSGPNGAIPHNPTSERELRDGDNVVVDSVITHDGFNNDLTRTYAVGTPSDKARTAYRVVREAHDAAIAAAAPGVECRELDRIARRIIEQAGFGEFFTHRLGHGMGIECHEPPYLNGANTEKLREGMCVTIEPGIYVPGEFGVRIEDDILITASGCEVISRGLPVDLSPAFA